MSGPQVVDPWYITSEFDFVVTRCSVMGVYVVERLREQPACGYTDAADASYLIRVIF